MNPKVSVVIPVYRAEKYIEHCIRSVMDQTLRELEIIVVNDCTPDRSMEIVERMQQEDSRIIAIENPKNLGAGPSRNAGLKQAVGGCIQFLDADDWLEAETLATAYHVLKDTDAQFVAYGMKRSTSSEKDHAGQSNKTEPTEKTLEAIKATGRCAGKYVHITDKRQWLDMLSKREISIYVWDKLYDAAFLKNNNLYFDDMYATEDYAFNFKIYPYIEKIVMIPEVFYNFRVNQSSATQGQLTARNIEAHLQLICSALKFLADYHLEKSEAGRRIIDDIFAIMKQMFSRYFRHGKMDKGVESIITDCVEKYFGGGKECGLITLMFIRICSECESAVAFMKADSGNGEAYEVFDKSRQVIADIVKSGRLTDKDRIIIYGTGNWGKSFYKALAYQGIPVIAFTNSEQKEVGNIVHGLLVIPMEKIKDTAYTKILIASTYYVEISQTLDRAGYIRHKDYEYEPLW